MSNGSDPTRQISQMPYYLVSRTNKPGFRAWSRTNKPVLASIEGEYPTFVAKRILDEEGTIDCGFWMRMRDRAQGVNIKDWG